MSNSEINNSGETLDNGWPVYVKKQQQKRCDLDLGPVKGGAGNLGIAAGHTCGEQVLKARERA